MARQGSSQSYMEESKRQKGIFTRENVIGVIEKEKQRQQGKGTQGGFKKAKLLERYLNKFESIDSPGAIVDMLRRELLEEPLVKVNWLGVQSSGSPSIRNIVSVLGRAEYNYRSPIINFLSSKPIRLFREKYSRSRNRYADNQEVNFCTNAARNQAGIKHLKSTKFKEVCAAPDAASKMECISAYMKELKDIVDTAKPTSPGMNIEEMREHIFDELVHDFINKLGLVSVTNEQLGDDSTMELMLKFYEYYNGLILERESKNSHYYQVDYPAPPKYYQ